jgi:hypothetical protein
MPKRAYHNALSGAAMNTGALIAAVRRHGWASGFAERRSTAEGLASALGPADAIHDGGPPWVTHTTTTDADATFVEHPAKLTWHTDFSSLDLAPRWTVIWLETAGEPRGDWQIADIPTIVEQLTAADRRLLATIDLPFLNPGTEQPIWARVLHDGRTRFYLTALQRGLRECPVPNAIEVVDALAAAADACAVTVEARETSLLVLDQRRVLHTRLPAGVGRRSHSSFRAAR